MLCGIDAAQVREYVERDAKTYYGYTVASPILYKKPTVELREWAGGGIKQAGTQSEG